MQPNIIEGKAGQQTSKKSDFTRLKNSSVKLGQAANLLNGYSPSWLSTETGNNALIALANTPLKEIAIEVKPTSNTRWAPFPTVTFHEDAVSLLNQVIPYQTLNPDGEIKSPILPAGLLTIGDADTDAAQQKLSKTLGVDLSKDYGFVLAKLVRTDATAEHPINHGGHILHPESGETDFGNTTEFNHAIASLKRIKRPHQGYLPDLITSEIAHQYLDFYHQQGTHFVSGVTTGDVIFQVFAMPKDRMARAQKLFGGKSELTGEDAANFSQYTSSIQSGPYGYVEEYGQILSFSNSEPLKEAIEKGYWIESTFAETDSVFAPFSSTAKITMLNLDFNYRDASVTNVDMTPLVAYLDMDRKKIWQRVLKNALTQKYRGKLAINYKAYSKTHLMDELTKGEMPGSLSDIATPIINLYKTGLEWEHLQFVAPKEVKEFTLCANYVSGKSGSSIQVPGDDVMLRIQRLDQESLTNPTVLTLSEQGYANFNFSCQQCLGALIIQNGDTHEHFTIADGLEYTSQKDETGRSVVRIKRDTRKLVEDQTHAQRIFSSLQFCYSYAASELSNTVGQSPTTLEDFLKKSLLWITQLIPQTASDAGLIRLRIRALDLARLGSDSSLGSFVPVLPYADYKEQVDKIREYLNKINQKMDQYQEKIEQQKEQEQLIDVAKDLNQNIVQSGKLLAEYLDATVGQQKELAGYYKSIVDQKEKENAQQKATVAHLHSLVEHQRTAVKEAVDGYKAAIEEAQAEAAINFAVEIGMNVAENIFSPIPVIPDAGADPAEEAVKLTEEAKALKKAADRVQKLLDAIDKVNAFYEKASATADDMQSAQDTLDGLNDVLTANLAWEEMNIKMKTVLKGGPDTGGVPDARDALQDAFQILVLRGKAYTIAKSKAQQTSRSLYNEQQQRDLVNDQVKRLDKLKTHLNPAHIKDLEPSKIDLIGLTGSLGMIRSRMLDILASTFQLQDEVLQYTNLQPATAIQSFTTMGISAAIVQQGQKTLEAKTQLARYQPSTTTPIDIEVEIATDQLKNGGIHEFNLPFTDPHFTPYVDIRLDSVVARVEGLHSTESGNYLLELGYTGRPFFDRGASRNKIAFNTLSRYHQYIYQIEGNKPQFSDGGKAWSEEVTPITPFSTWQISLPNGSTNKGMKFDGPTVKVTLSFVATARINDSALLQNGISLNTAGQKPKLEALQDEMSHGSKLQGWDVVFNMTLEKINESLRDQYDALKQDSGFNNCIHLDIASSGISPNPDLAFDTLKSLSLEYGYPSLQFMTNNSSTCLLDLPIYKGSVTEGYRYYGPDTENTRTLLKEIIEFGHLTDTPQLKTIKGKQVLALEHFGPATKMEDGAKLTATVPLSKIQGDTSENKNILKVELDFKEGAFSANDLKVEMTDEQKESFKKSIKDFFINNDVTFNINKLDMSKLPGAEFLRPSQFFFKTLVTPMGLPMLQLYIQVDGNARPLGSPEILISDPIPEDSDTSIVISSRVLYNKVVPNSITNGWQCHGEKVEDNTGFYEDSFTNASVSLILDLSKASFVSGYTQFSYTPKKTPSTFYLTDLKISNGSNYGILLHLDQKLPFDYQEDGRHANEHGSPWDTFSECTTNIQTTIHAPMPMTITGNGRNQQISIKVLDDSTVYVEGHVGGACRTANATIKGQIHEQFKPKLEEFLKHMEFRSISIFALKNLLFPANNYINMTDISVPGDALLIGVFEKD